MRGGTQPPVATGAPSAPPAGDAPSGGSGPGDGPGIGSAIQGTIKLAPGAVAPPGATLFIIARTAGVTSGPPDSGSTSMPSDSRYATKRS